MLNILVSNWEPFLANFVSIHFPVFVGISLLTCYGFLWDHGIRNENHTVKNHKAGLFFIKYPLMVP